MVLLMVDRPVFLRLRGATVSAESSGHILAMHFPVRMLLMLMDPTGGTAGTESKAHQTRSWQKWRTKTLRDGGSKITISIIFTSIFSLAVGDYQILVTGYIYVVGITIGVPKQVVFKRCNKLSSEIPNSHSPVSECQEKMVLIEEDECRRCHEFSAANFNEL